MVGYFSSNYLCQVFRLLFNWKW